MKNDQKELKVSVEMITFKHELYIQKAIEGVLMQQTNFDFELIIADDCSPDSTPEIIEEIINRHPQGHRIKYFRHKENIGMQTNAIFAYNQCKGTYIALCEGDDYWIDPLKLQKQVDFLETNLDYALCFHSVNILKKDGTIVDDFITKVPENYENIETLARLGNYIHTPSVVFRNVIKEFPFEFMFSPIGDYFLYIMLAEYGKLKCLNEKMAVYRYGVGVFSSKNGMDISAMLNKQYACMLSYLKDEKVKRIILERNIELIKKLEFSIKTTYASHNYIAINKSFLDLMKIIFKKIFKYKLNSRQSLT